MFVLVWSCISTNRGWGVVASSWVQALLSRLQEIIPREQERVKKIRKEHGNVKLGEVTVDQVSPTSLPFFCSLSFPFFSVILHALSLSLFAAFILSLSLSLLLSFSLSLSLSLCCFLSLSLLPLRA